MSTPHEQEEQASNNGVPSFNPRTWGIIILASLAVFFALLAINSIFGDEDNGPGGSRNASQRSQDGSNIGDGTQRTAAKPTASMDKVDGCTDPNDKDVDKLLDSLDDDGAEAVLSTAWSGEEDGEKRDAVALMVRSGEGTIDEPHFIWMRDGDSFKSVTKGTADVSSMDSDLSQATSAMVANSINCLTADFR